jgi:hypothetical protein
MKELKSSPQPSDTSKKSGSGPTKEELIAYEKKKQTLSDRLGTHEVGSTMHTDIKDELAALTAKFHSTHFQ